MAAISSIEPNVLVNVNAVKYLVQYKKRFSVFNEILEQVSLTLFYVCRRTNSNLFYSQKVIMQVLVSSLMLYLTRWKFTLHKKWSFPLRISSINLTKSAGNCDLVTFTEEILHGKFHFLCSVSFCGFLYSETLLSSLPKLLPLNVLRWSLKIGPWYWNLYG